MSLHDTLATVFDTRKQDERSAFHGYLEDYISLMENDDPIRTDFEQFLKLDSQSKILVDLVIPIHKEVISNQIIRYKDALKIPSNHLRCPFIIYGINKQDQSYGVIYYPGSIDDYLLVKGIYFSLSEQGALFQHHRNQLFALTSEQLQQQVETLNKIIEGKISIGSLQRELDRKVFASIAQLEDIAQMKTAQIKDNFLNQIQTHPDKQTLIYDTIGNWFLCKKAVYVQVMTNKLWLTDIFDQNIKKQRHQAKVLSDSLIFMPLSEMWRI